MLPEFQAPCPTRRKYIISFNSIKYVLLYNHRVYSLIEFQRG